MFQKDRPEIDVHQRCCDAQVRRGTDRQKLCKTQQCLREESRYRAKLPPVIGEQGPRCRWEGLAAVLHQFRGARVFQSTSLVSPAGARAATSCAGPWLLVRFVAFFIVLRADICTRVGLSPRRH